MPPYEVPPDLLARIGERGRAALAEFEAQQAARQLAKHAPSPVSTPSTSPTPSSTTAVDMQQRRVERRLVKPSAADEDDYSPAGPSSSSSTRHEAPVTRSRACVKQHVEASESDVETSEDEPPKAEDESDDDDEVTPHEQRRSATPSPPMHMPRDIREVVSRTLARERLESPGATVSEMHVLESKCCMPATPNVKPRSDLSKTKLTFEFVRVEWHHLVGQYATFGALAKAINRSHKVTSSPAPTLASFAAMADAERAPVSKANSDLDASHLCGQPTCFQRGHVVLESNAVNTSRDRCHSGQSASRTCPHEPPCLELVRPKSSARTPQAQRISPGPSKSKSKTSGAKKLAFSLASTSRSSGSSSATRVEVGSSSSRAEAGAAGSQTRAIEVVQPVVVQQAAAAAAVAPVEDESEDESEDEYEDIVIDDSQPAEAAATFSPVAASPSAAEQVVVAVIAPAEVTPAEVEVEVEADEEVIDVSSPMSDAGDAPPSPIVEQVADAPKSTTWTVAYLAALRPKTARRLVAFEKARERRKAEREQRIQAERERKQRIKAEREQRRKKKVDATSTTRRATPLLVGPLAGRARSARTPTRKATRAPGSRSRSTVVLPMSRRIEPEHSVDELECGDDGEVWAGIVEERVIAPLPVRDPNRPRQLMQACAIVATSIGFVGFVANAAAVLLG
ncbi:hypothetical protein JCM3775_002691 [Rhodotorula graminis]